MLSVPGIGLLPNNEQQIFSNEFQREVEFFEFLILMLSRSLPTGSVDITWMDGHEGLRQVLGTTQAAKGACSRYLSWDRPDPSQHFCNIVSDHGRRAAESCAVCENAAEKRVGASGQAQVYRCHAGLTDIAVPVMADGHHIATLYSGQVLTASPSTAGFQSVAKDIERLRYVDVEELKKAYWNVPVVSESDIENAVKLLEVFAGYLGRFWKRLADTASIERQKLRSNQLAAKEFGYMVLRPELQDRARLHKLMKQLGFSLPPNRVMVIKLDNKDTSSVSFDVAFTQALGTIETISEQTANVAIAHLGNHGVCVFFRELTEQPSAGLRARSLAEKFIAQISAATSIAVRVGIGGVQSDWQNLSESYHEASLALAGSSETVAVWTSFKTSISELMDQIQSVRTHLADQRVDEALVSLRTVPLLANRCLGTNGIADHRNILLSALESIASTALDAGCEPQRITRLRSERGAGLSKAATVFDLHLAFLETADAICEEVGKLLFGKHEKVVARVQEMLERLLEKGSGVEAFSLSEAARLMGVSTGHLSRTFRRVTGVTFLEFTLARRIEHARRLLLDPLNNVNAVAERCGFSTSAYFARVFRKFTGCAPTEYTSNPRLQHRLQSVA